MANFLADLSLRFTAMTAELKKGFDQAKTNLKTFQGEVYGIGQKISKNFSEIGQKLSDQLDKLQPGLGALANAGMKAFNTLIAGAKGFAAVFISTGIGAIIAAVAAALAGLVMWMKRSQEGSDALAKIIGFLKGLLEGVLKLAMNLGEWLSKAFTDPKQAIKDLGDFLWSQLVNRFKGLVDIFVGGWEVIKNGAIGVGLAIAGIFSKKAREESKKYFEDMADGLKKMGQGVVAFTTGFTTDQIKDFWTTIKESGKEGERLAQVQNELNAKESKFIKMNADDAIKLASLKRQLADMEGKTDEEKIKKAALIEQSSEIQNRISQRAIILAKEKYDLLVATNKLQGKTNDEAVRAEAEAYADWKNAIAAAENAQVKFEKQENRVQVAAKKTVEELRKEAEERYWLTTTFEGQLTELEKLYKEGEVGLQEYIDRTNEIWQKFKWGPAEEAFKANQEREEKAKDAAKKSLEEQLTGEKLHYDEKIKLLEDGKTAELLTAKEIADYKAELDMQERDRKLELANASLAATTSILDSISGLQQANMEKELAAAGDNEAKKDAIRKKYAQKEKKMMIAKAIMGTAMAVINALQTQPFIPLGLIAAAAATAAGAIQIATIQAQPLAKGGIAYGETLATVGEYTGARNNPEVIAPLDKLKNILGDIDGGQREVKFVIEQSSLVGILTEYNRKNIYF